MDALGKALWLLFSLLLTGCAEGPPSPESAAATPIISGSRFDAAHTGAIAGCVLWQGKVPAVKPFVVPPLQFGLIGPRDRLQFDNPNVPQVEPHGRGVADAVVFLRGVDPQQARPWDHPPVEVEQRDFRLLIRQGSVVSRVGFVQRGAAVTLISRQAVFHSLHADGAAFFTFAFADPDQPYSRPLKECGLVELSSAANYFWMRAYLFVADQPYFCRTDGNGRFVLPAVPPGDYELVCWLPSWKEDRHHRDPESCVIMRMYFRPAVEHGHRVQVRPGVTSSVDFRFSEADFEP